MYRVSQTIHLVPLIVILKFVYFGTLCKSLPLAHTQTLYQVINHDYFLWLHSCQLINIFAPVINGPQMQNTAYKRRDICSGCIVWTD